jgi:hypothetical protein
VSHRPLALLSGLTLGDYLLWKWSLGGSHDVLALASGLTLPPLVIACLWLLALSLARLLARSTRRLPVQAGRRGAGAQRQKRREARASSTTAGSLSQSPDSPASSASSAASRKLAA